MGDIIDITATSEKGHPIPAAEAQCAEALENLKRVAGAHGVTSVNPTPTILAALVALLCGGENTDEWFRFHAAIWDRLAEALPAEAEAMRQAQVQQMLLGAQEAQRITGLR